KAIRLRNPTDSVLESGPVTVFSAGRFIGEGLVEPIPARPGAFVPFALARPRHTRQEEKSGVSPRPTVQPGYKLTKAPAVSERMGLAHLFRVELAPKAKTEVEIEEGTPVLKTTDVRAADGMELVNVYLSSAVGNEPLRN